MLHTGSIAARGFAAERVPWANMFEFTLTATAIIVGVFLLGCGVGALVPGTLADRFGRGSQGKGALIVVTHDRWFLDAVCTRMWEVTGSVGKGTVAQYEGGYAAYVLARAERARSAASSADKRNNLLRKELAWLHRGARARSTKPKFRMDAAAELIADEPPPRDQLELTRMATTRLGKDVLDVEGVTLTFPNTIAGGAPRVLFDDLTWRLGPGDRRAARVSRSGSCPSGARSSPRLSSSSASGSPPSGPGRWCASSRVGNGAGCSCSGCS